MRYSVLVGPTAHAEDANRLVTNATEQAEMEMVDSRNIRCFLEILKSYFTKSIIWNPAGAAPRQAGVAEEWGEERAPPGLVVKTCGPKSPHQLSPARRRLIRAL